MTGILAINAFLHSEKYTQQDKLLLAGAKACGINLKIYSNLELRLAVPKADFVLFWDKDVSLAHALEQQGLPVFNSAKAIALCKNARQKAELFSIERTVAQLEALYQEQ